MGHFGCSFYFADLPNIEIIKDKICNYSGLNVVLVTFPEIELHFELEHKSLEMDIMVEISIMTNEPISKIYLSCISDKIDKQYYFYRLISAVLVDLGGIPPDEFFPLPVWARVKWQGQKWFKKITESPHFFSIMLDYRTSL